MVADDTADDDVACKHVSKRWNQVHLSCLMSECVSACMIERKFMMECPMVHLMSLWRGGPVAGGGWQVGMLSRWGCGLLMA